MIYSAPRFNYFFRFLRKVLPCSFVDNFRTAFMNLDKIDLSDTQGVVDLYTSNFEPLTRLRVYNEESIRKMIKTVYMIMDTYGLDHSYIGEEETFHLISYPTGIDDFLLYKGYKEKPDDNTFQLFSAFLYVMDAFIRGEKMNQFSMESAMKAFDFPRHFPELDYLSEAESLSRGADSLYNSIKKAVDIPEYLEDSYILVDDVFYEKESVNKAIDGWSMTAQSLERQDLEGGMVDLNMKLSEDERIINFIKMLKDRRKREKNEFESESKMDR